MTFRDYRTNGLNGDIRGEKGVEPDQELIRIESRVDVGMEELLDAVDARVGPATSDDGYGFPEQRREGVL